MTDERDPQPLPEPTGENPGAEALRAIEQIVRTHDDLLANPRPLDPKATHPLYENLFDLCL